MSLYFEERIDERKEDPANDKIVFTYPWIIEVPPAVEEEGDIYFRETFTTCYNFGIVGWKVRLADGFIQITKFNSGSDALLAFGEETCCISYILYYDNDMRLEFYSSPRAVTSASYGDFLFLEIEFFKKLFDAFMEGKVKKIAIFFELHLPTKNFCRPFDHRSHYLQSKTYDKFPEDMDNDFRFEFLKDGDFSIKCSNGSIPALRMVLNVSSKFMKKQLKESNDVELVVEHSLDVVKPIVLYLHSRCFEMPKSFNLDFAERLFKAIDFFQPEDISKFHVLIELSMCQKFVEEPVDFDSILRWLSVAFRHRMSFLSDMIVAVITSKFYFKWFQIFPENARNSDNPYFRDIFGLQGDTEQIFEKIETIFCESLCTNVILN